MHLLPTFRWRLALVPLGLDHPYWVDDGTFDVEYHVRRGRASRAGHSAAAGRAGGSPDRQAAGSGAPAVGAVRHPGAGGRRGGGDDEDASRGRRRRLRRRGHERAARRHRDRSGPGAAPAVVAERFPSEVEMLGRGLVGMLRQPLRALRAAPTTLPHLDDVPTLRHLPGVKAIARERPTGQAADSRRRRRTRPAGQRPRRAPDPISNPAIGAPPGRVRVAVPR